jgi:hypothetical protein
MSLPTELQFDDLSYRTEGLYQRVGKGFFHVEYFPVGQTSTNAAMSVVFFRQPLSTDTLDQLVDGYSKALEEWRPKAVLTVLEKSERHVILKDMRFDGTLAGRPLFIIYLYELEGRTLLTSQFMFKPRRPFDSPKVFSKEFATKETRWLKELQQVSRIVHESISLEANIQIGCKF